MMKSGNNRKWKASSKKRRQLKDKPVDFDFKNHHNFILIVDAVVQDMGRRLRGKNGRMPEPPSVVIFKEEEGQIKKYAENVSHMSPYEAAVNINMECDERCIGVILLWALNTSKVPGKLWIHVEHTGITPREITYIEKNGYFVEHSHFAPQIRLMQIYNPKGEFDLVKISKAEFGAFPLGGRGTGSIGSNIDSANIPAIIMPPKRD